MKQVRGKQVIERLVHFNCGLCHRWWSVASAPAAKRHWFCPWCGVEQPFSGRRKST
ncbi:MAG: hypothetical protein HY974_03640 [Candidatus Kerfeldbacteria bacterium]|nr:hypothetical protein [Candidatus Kerfeldbacteria bacterium]